MKPAIGSVRRLVGCVGFAAALTGAGVLRAAPIAYDTLESASRGALNGVTSGTGFSAGYTAAAGATVVAQSLSYDNGDIQLSGGTNCIRATNPDATVFTRGMPAHSGDVLYLGFLFRTPTADGSGTGSAEDFLSCGFNNAVGEATAGIMHRLNATGTDHGFGIRVSSSVEFKTSLATEKDRTYLIVLRLRKLTPGATQPYNELALFIDPSTLLEPAPTLVATNTRWAAATHLAARVALSESGDTYYLDNLSIGTSYDSVLFPLGDGPIAAQPVISPLGGTALGSQTVTLSTATAGASIRYTTDGSTPGSTNGTLYTGPFQLQTSSLVQAVACMEGKADSAVASARFLIQTQWSGAGSDNNWSTAANWTPARDPAGQDLVFSEADRTFATVPNSVITTDTTIGSLLFTNTTINPPATGKHWHYGQIGVGTTLTVDGRSAPPIAVLIGGMYRSGEWGTHVKLGGGGALIVDAPASEFVSANASNNDRGDTTFDLSGLSLFRASVSAFRAGRGARTQAIVSLAAAGDGTNTIAAPRIAIGDGDGALENNGTSEIRLGRANVIHTDILDIAATVPGKINVENGRLSFQSGLGGGRVRIRGASGGDSRANLTLGSHGAARTIRNVTGTFDVSAGTVDALLGSVTIGEGRGYWASSGGTGSMNGLFSMSGGSVDATSVVLGRSLYNDSTDTRNNIVTATISMSGGRFRTGSINMAENAAGTKSNQRVLSTVSLSGSADMTVNGDVTMGTRYGVAAAVTARVQVVSGSLTVTGNMTPGPMAAGVSSEVRLHGGRLAVTNAAGVALLRIEQGLLDLVAGTLQTDRLIMTNALAKTVVELRGTGAGGFCPVTVNGEVRLGGDLTVRLNGYQPAGGDGWDVVNGKGTRIGTFSSVNVPAPLKLIYTDSGFRLHLPSAGTVLLIR